MDASGVERALGAIGTTFRLSRLYPQSHPAVVEAMRQITTALPALAAAGTVEWKIGATGFHWQGQHLLPRNAQVAELAGLLYARGIRAVQINPGVTADHAIALFGVATGTVPQDDAALGQIAFTLSRRSRTSAPAISSDAPATPPAEVAVAAGAPASAPVPERRATGAFRFDAVPIEVQVQRAIADLGTSATLEAQRAAVAALQSLTPALLALRDVSRVAAAIVGLDRLLATVTDAGLASEIGLAADALTTQAGVDRMVARLGEPGVTAAERETLIAALGALATLSMNPVLHAYLGAPTDRREPYRAVVRHAGERALEPLQERLTDTDVSVLAATAELAGLSGSPQAVPLLLPFLRHGSELVREGAVNGLAEIGGRDIARPLMPALKDESVMVRIAAARAIAAAGDAASVTVLLRRLDQEADEAVLAELLRAIGRLVTAGGGGRDALAALARLAEPGSMLRRRNAMVRAAAIEAIAHLPGGEARGLLELYSHDKEPAVRKAAEAALR